MPYSHEIITTKPERICIYDETRIIKLGCTKTGDRDKTIMASKTKKAKIIVTKSLKKSSVVCGCLGDGRSMPVFICYASGESF